MADDCGRRSRLAVETQMAEKRNDGGACQVHWTLPPSLYGLKAPL